MNINTLPLATERTKAARDFEAGDVIRVPKSKAEWLQDPHGSAYRRYRILSKGVIGRYGYEFIVEDVDTHEVKQQGFGSQILYVIEE